MFYILLVLALINIAVTGYILFDSVRDYKKIKNWSKPLHDKRSSGEEVTHDDLHEALAHAVARGQFAAFMLAIVFGVWLVRITVDLLCLLWIK